MNIKIFLLIAILLSFSAFKSHATEHTIRIIAFGDSLMSGYGLKPAQSFPAQLESTLIGKGYDVEIVNAGISGETSAGGLRRVERIIATAPDIIIFSLGANDMLKKLPPENTRSNLDNIMWKLHNSGIKIILSGIKAHPKAGSAYKSRFDPIYPYLAERYKVEFYPHFLENVALVRSLNLRDGAHPNARGISTIVRGILPHVERTLNSLK